MIPKWLRPSHPFFGKLLELQGLDGIEEPQFQNIKVWNIWWLIWKLHMNTVMLHSLNNSIICTSCVRIGIVLPDNETLISDGILIFNCWDHLVNKHLCNFHPVGASNEIYFHCTRCTVLTYSFCCLFENGRLDANLAIEHTIGMTVPSWPIYCTHAHNLGNILLTFICSMRRLFTRNELEFCIDLCHVELLFINMNIVIHCVKTLIPRIHRGLCEL